MKAAAFAVPCLFALLVAIPRPATADGWYGAVDIGSADYLDVEGSGNVFPPTAPFVDTPGTPTHPIAYRFDAGYRFTPHFSLEGGYVYLGSTEISGTQQDCTIGLGIFTCYQPFTVSASLRTSGLVMDAIGTQHVGDHLSLFVEGGLIFAHSVSADATINSGGSFGKIADANSIRPTFGLGAGWDFSQQTTFRLSWNRFANLQATNTFTAFDSSFPKRHYSVQVLSLGIVYSF